MYRRPKFLEILLEIRETMSREADFDVGAFAEKNLSAAPPDVAADFTEPREKKRRPVKNKIRLEQKIELKIGRDEN